MKKSGILLALMLSIVACLFVSGSQSHGAGTVFWSAVEDNGIGTSSGTDLAINSLLRIGRFTISDSVIQSNQFDLAFLNSNFVEFGSASIGDGGEGVGSWLASSSGDVTGFTGQRIYLWAFDAPTIGAASEHGIFYSASSVNWVFPGDTLSTTWDLTELTDGPGTSLTADARIVVGSFGIGTSDNYGGPLFNLAPVPDPSTYLLFSLGLGVLAIARRRQR